MSQVITCPNCEKKLTLKDRPKGRAVICPHCMNRFTVAAAYERAAEAEASFALGTHYKTIRNHEEAIKWYQLADMQHHAGAAQASLNAMRR